MIPAGCYAVGLFSRADGMEGLRTLGMMALVIYIGGIVSGLLAAASLVCGVACARRHRHVLFWVAPLWLVGGYGLAAGLFMLVLWLNGKLAMFPAGKGDDFGAMAAIWGAAAVVIGLASWLLGGVYGRRLRWFPWWSVPLWAAVVFGVIMLIV